MLKGEDVKALPKKLIDMANAGGGHDNITAVVVRVEKPQLVAGTIPPDDDRAEELARKVEVLKRMPLFRHLAYKEIMRVLNVTEVKEYAAGRGDHQGGRPPATRCSSSCAARSACTRTTRSSPTWSRARTSARWRWSTAATRARPAPPPRSARACSSCRRKDFYEIIRKEPQLSTKLLWSFVQVLADRLRKTTADLSGARLEAGAEDLTADVLFEEK